MCTEKQMDSIQICTLYHVADHPPSFSTTRCMFYIMSKPCHIIYIIKPLVAYDKYTLYLKMIKFGDNVFLAPDKTTTLEVLHL